MHICTILLYSQQGNIIARYREHFTIL